MTDLNLSSSLGAIARWVGVITSILPLLPSKNEVQDNTPATAHPHTIGETMQDEAHTLLADIRVQASPAAEVE